jgi:hypothetical protein
VRSHPTQAPRTPHIIYYGSHPSRRLIRGIHSRQCRRQLSDQSRTLTDKGTFFAQQQLLQRQQQQIRAQTVQHPPSPQIQPFRRPSLPMESEMPDEWGYPPSSTPQVSSMPSSHVHGVSSRPPALADTPRNIQSAVMLPTGCAPRGGVPQSHPTTGTSLPAVPTCRHPNCGLTRDERTQGLSEYCSLDHMRFVVSFCKVPLFVLWVAEFRPIWCT